jgi:hypothetical protein
MKITREETTVWNYPCFGRAEDGDVVWFTKDGVGVVVRGATSFDAGWIMDRFTPIDNPFEKKFNPITIVLETEEEFHAMLHAMGNEDTIKDQDWSKLDNLVNNNKQSL